MSSFVTCPYCGSSNIFYTHAERKFECRKCGKSWHKKEEKKELPLKRTLEPFVEAARVKPLTEFKSSPQLPWPNPEPEAIVEEVELPTFAEWLKATVKRVWETKKGETHWEWLIEPTDGGVLVGLRGVSRPHEFFPADIIEKIGRKFPEERGPATFFFAADYLRKRAAEILKRNHVDFSYGPPEAEPSPPPLEGGYTLIDIDDPDYALEILASERFDTSGILVERG